MSGPGLFQIGWGHQRDWFTVCQTGSSCELAMMGSIHDLHGYLPVVLDQGPGYVDSFRRTGLRAWLYRAIFYTKGFSNLAITIPSHYAGIT